MDDILRIYMEKKIFPSMIWETREDGVRRIRVENLQAMKGMIGQHPSLKVFIAEDAGHASAAGYMVVHLNRTEPTTGEQQGLLYDYGLSEGCNEKAVFFAMLGEAEKALHAQDMKYLIVDVYRKDEQGTALLDEAGFARESNRVVKKVEERIITPRELEPFTVRKAESADRYFITWLNSEFTGFTMLGGREKKQEDIQCRFLEAYSTLALEETDDFLALIIEDRHKEEPIGYMMLKTDSFDVFTGKRLAYVYDMAIHSEYWKTRAAWRMMKETENHLVGKGIHFIMGDISEKNQRALKGALKLIGFTVDRVRWMRKI
jgi:hypothetical protein